MTFARVKPGSWATGEKLSSPQQNQLDLNVSRALDGYAGGTYTPSDPLIINGDGLQTSVAPATGNAVANKTYVDAEVAATNSELSKLGLTAQFRLGNTSSSLTTATVVTPISETLDTGFSIVSTNRIKVPHNGIYRYDLYAYLQAGGGTPSSAKIAVRKNGSAQKEILGATPAIGGVEQGAVVGSHVIRITDYVNDYIDLYIDAVGTCPSWTIQSQAWTSFVLSLERAL